MVGTIVSYARVMRYGKYSTQGSERGLPVGHNTKFWHMGTNTAALLGVF